MVWRRKVRAYYGCNNGGVHDFSFRSAHSCIGPALPADDLTRSLVLASPDDADRPHIGLVGDTYTVLLSGKETAGRFCLIDMHIPPGGGPPPHRHDFEETFILLDGKIEATFRGAKSVVQAGETIHIPANAPHQFHNSFEQPVRLLCLCSPAGQEEFFEQVGGKGGDTDDSAACSGCGGSGGFSSKGGGAGSEVPDRVFGAGLRR